jgi:uncharacterized Rossmann fold enzyme
MRLEGWEQKYREILREFGINRKDDLRAAKLLNLFLGDVVSLNTLERRIRSKTVFVVGAGPSLSSCMVPLGKFKHITKIVADGATRALIENGIRPDIVVTDLDGNLEYLKKASKTATMIVHSHGDNIGVLPFVLLFKRCIGTTEGKPFGKIRNFGGFTDGDRCVFLARYFGAKKIILLGMDFGIRIGSYSKQTVYDKTIKIRKMRKAKSLLEWLASKDRCEFYTTTGSIRGFQKIRLSELESVFS